MRSWAVVQFGEPLELVERPLPELTGTQVLVKNLYAGVCHSDLHNWTNDFGLGNPPCTLGHEMEGELVAVGPDVPHDSVRLGARYLVFPWIGCGAAQRPCKMCALGLEQTCVVGSPQAFCDGRTFYGGYNSHVVLPHHRYLIDSSAAAGLPDGLACVYMCSGLTVFSALKKIGQPPQGAGDVLVLGCGGLGLQAIQFARFLFGGPPCAADVAPHARAAAEAMGCRVYDPRRQGVVEEILKDTNGGFFAVLDLVGSTDTVTFSSGVVHSGGCVVLVGLFGGEARLPVPYVAGRSLRYQGNLTGSLAEAHEMLKAVKAGAVQPIPHQIRDISEINEVFSDLKEGRILGRCILRHEGAVRTRL